MIPIKDTMNVCTCIIPDATFGLPWYTKMYWALFNTTVPMAFFITIYYYSLLAGYVGK